MKRHAFAIAAMLIGLNCLALAQSRIRYTISLADPKHHLIRVSVSIPPGRAAHELQLPVWNALYQVRDFSQYMNYIRAQDADGHPLLLEQLNASRWEIAGAEQGAKVEYEMFANDPGPFGAELNPRHAFFNLAEILIYVDDARSAPQQVKFTNVLPGWTIATALALDVDLYSAANYDQLVDSPVEISDFTEQDFQGPCGTYRVVLDSPGAAGAIGKILPPIQHIVAEASRWMNDCPFQTYMFIYHATDSPGSGGMEHAYSTAISLNQKDFTGNLDHFTAVTGHEFFHLWNVKRIRPQSLEPVDYTKENYTRALWFSEGVDTTASNAIRLRAGLLDERHYLENLSRAITELENRPARLTQSVEQASLDAWLEKYPRYALPERSISYYNKGELLGVLLDLRLREATHDRASLQSLFRWMNERYAKQGTFYFDSDAVRQAVVKISGAGLEKFFSDYVSGTREIPWDEFFAYVGLRVIKSNVTLADPQFEATQVFDRPLTVQQVTPEGEAQRAGLKPDDVILEINGEQPQRDFATQIAALGPGATLQLTVSRNGAHQTLQWKLSSRTRSVFRLQDVPVISPQQKAERAAWLFDKGEDKGEKSAPAAKPAQ